MIYESTYKVITPSGVFDAVWGEYPLPVEYHGNPAAIQHFKNFLALNHVSGEHGILLNEKTLEPNELYGFCQPTGSGITVIPPLDDLIAYAREDRELDQQDDESNDVAIWKQITDKDHLKEKVQSLKDRLDNGERRIVIDSANTQELNNVVTPTGIEKLKLAKEVKGIRSSLASVASGIEKLKMIKRVKEIRVILGGVAQEVEPVAEVEETEPQATQADAKTALKYLKGFIGQHQLNAIATAMRGEEKQYFFDKLVALAKHIKKMPKTYDQDGLGDKAIAYLHYFKNNMDWYITERDMDDDNEGQLQAFGLANLGHGGEMGYISIVDLIKSNVEIDLYWDPKTIHKIKGKDDEEVATEEANPGLSQEEIDDYEKNRIADPETDEIIEPETENTPVPIPEDSELAVTPESTEPGAVDNPIEEPEQETAEVENLVQPIEPVQDQNNIVMNEGSGVVINQLYKQWEAIKSEYDQTDWEDSVINTKFGSFGTTPFLDVLKTFEPKFKNSVLEENFMKEVKKALSKPAPLALSTETEKQKRKLQSLTDLQERMKAANKIVKSKTLTDEQKQEKLEALGEDYYRLMRPDFAGRVGYADYLLTNNNATIRNTQKRIAQLEAQDLAAAKASSGDSATSYDFDGGSIDLDYADDRLKVNFDSKPDSDMRDKLKQNGFNWSPTNGTWQRKLTDNAISTANYIFGTNIQTAASAMNEEKNKPSENGIVAPVVNASIETEVFNELKNLGWITGKYDGGLASLENRVFSVVTMASKTKDGGVGFVCEVSLSNGADAGSLNVHIPTIEVQSGDTASIVAEKIDIIVNNAIKSPVFLAYAKRYGIEINETPTSQDNPMKAAFESELNALQMESDVEAYLNKLEVIVDRIEKAGLLEDLDGVLNVTSDKLTDMLAAAEKQG
ncbi:MAG: hypothetical protein WC856_02390 [Methylococcaceae bacterium]|jgi:hypothetical protein